MTTPAWQRLALHSGDLDDSGHNASPAGAPFQWVLRAGGVLSVATDVADFLKAPANVRIDEVQAHVGTAPATQALIVDVNADGVTIFTTQANRPSVAAATNDATSGTPDGGTSIAKDSVLTVDVDQVGTGTPGSDLTVHLRGIYL